MPCAGGIVKFNHHMRIRRFLMWLVFVFISVFLWTVFFTYGGDPGQFYFGAREELSRIFDWLARALDQ